MVSMDTTTAGGTPVWLWTRARVWAWRRLKPRARLMVEGLKNWA